MQHHYAENGIAYIEALPLLWNVEYAKKIKEKK